MCSHLELLWVKGASFVLEYPIPESQGKDLEAAAGAMC